MNENETHYPWWGKKIKVHFLFQMCSITVLEVQLISQNNQCDILQADQSVLLSQELGGGT